MRSLRFDLDQRTSENDLLDLIAELNADPAVHGILIQLPLPDHIDSFTVLEAVNPLKDVDGFHAENVGRLSLAQPGMIPCTPRGCLMLLTEQLASLEGKYAVVVGCSNIVGRPMAQLLLQARCTVSLAHIHTAKLPAVVALADILVVATGSPGLIRGSWLKPGVVVIDVGINRIIDPTTGRHRIVGDVRLDEALGVAAAITPVPGGVGPMTIACLLQNTVLAALRQCAPPDRSEMAAFEATDAPTVARRQAA